MWKLFVPCVTCGPLVALSCVIMGVRGSPVNAFGPGSGYADSGFVSRLDTFHYSDVANFGSGFWIDRSLSA